MGDRRLPPDDHEAGDAALTSKHAATQPESGASREVADGADGHAIAEPRALVTTGGHHKETTWYNYTTLTYTSEICLDVIARDEPGALPRVVFNDAAKVHMTLRVQPAAPLSRFATTRARRPGDPPSTRKCCFWNLGGADLMTVTPEQKQLYYSLKIIPHHSPDPTRSLIHTNDGAARRRPFRVRLARLPALLSSRRSQTHWMSPYRSTRTTCAFYARPTSVLLKISLTDEATIRRLASRSFSPNHFCGCVGERRDVGGARRGTACIPTRSCCALPRRGHDLQGGRQLIWPASYKR